MSPPRHAACPGVPQMEPTLTRPSPAPWQSPEDMLDEIEKLNEAILQKLEFAPEAAQARFRDELTPRLEAVRKLVAQKSPMAKNALEDLVVLFREFHITALARVTYTPM